MHLLVIDDNPLLSDTISSHLSPEHSVDSALSGSTGLQKLTQNDYDAVVLDVKLPDLSGAQVCQLARQRGYHKPILILSGYTQTQHKLELFQAGADDYVTKPFAIAEVKARLKALTHRQSPSNQHGQLEWYDVTIDLDRYRVERQGMTLALPPKEFEILTLFLQSPYQIHTKDQIAQYVWPYYAQPNSNTIEAHIKKLRSLVDKPFTYPYIDTIRGRGYRLLAPPERR